MSYKITVTGADKVREIASKAGPQMPQIIGRYIKEKGDKIVGLYKGSVPVVTGAYRGSISGRVTGTERYVGGSFNIPYANKVEANFCRKHGRYHHNLYDAVNGIISEMRGGQELADRLKGALGI